MYGESNTNTDNNTGLLTKGKRMATETGTVGNDTHNGGNNSYGYHGVYENSSSNYSVVAGVEYPNGGGTGTDTGNTAGQYLDIAVIPGGNMASDVVVFVWYDGKDLNYTYRYGIEYDENDDDDKDKDDDIDALSTGVTGKWSATKTIFEKGAEIGEHCAVTVDAKGGIHIAAYSRSGADLYYAYLSDKDAKPKTCLVDSYSQVGTNLAIDVAFKDNDKNKAVPYISYYADGFNGLPKVAYFEDGISSATDVVDGVDFDTDMFTGKWEVALVPTESTIRNDNVNVGVWKTAGETAGVRKKPTVKTSSAGDTGMCYGNGKSYFVLGYATEEGLNGNIETAQLK